MTSDRNEEILSRMGSIISNGIINAAGRNATICLTTRDGNIRQNAIKATNFIITRYKAYRVGQKRFVLGCVIPPAGAVARSRNLGQTFLANSVPYHPK